MEGRTTTGAASGDAKRRVGQAVVVAVCIVSLVVAGAIAPTVGSPFSDGPSLNASQFGANASALGNATPSNVSQDARDAAGQRSETSPPQVIGSPDRSAVGGEEALTGFRNQSGGIQFVVQAPENTYYRVGAYQSFDGYGWSRSGERTAFSGAVPGPTPPGSALEARVTLNSSALAVPVPWRPTTVNGPTPLSVRETGGIVPRQSLAPTESFSVQAVQPTRDPAVLSETGYDYPSRVERAYAEVSLNVSGRVVELADRVTADASNPYEEARAIEAWLESNKEYSLDATTDPDRPVTRQFLFEMDRGYCQYFASSMAVMLRSQGIPARYVVGYAPGTEIGENTYAVTGSKAHAWVEVYFEDVGWVRFDPTPAADREAADEAVATRSDVAASFEESNVSDAVNASDGPSSAETDGETSGNGTGEDETGNEAGDGTGGDGETGDDDGDGSTGSSVQVSLNRTPAPGSDVTVTVTRNGDPVRLAEVYFNDEYVGTTNYRGEVVATVPYASDLTVRVEDVDDAVRSAVAVPGPPGVDSASGSERRFDVEAVPSSAVVTSAQSWTADGDGGGFDPPDNGSNSTTEEFEVTTDMTFSLAAEPVPGERVWLQVSIDGQPVPAARVGVDGERVGATNRTGWVRVPLPAEESDVTVAARRGAVADAAELQLLTNVNVTADGSAVPGSTLRVTATYDGEALADGVVAVDGERVGTTDDAGMVTVDVPVDAEGSMTVTVEDGVRSGSVSTSVVTNASFGFEEPPSPGADVVVLVRAANESVADATVAVDGARAGQTDGAGLATVSIPENATGNVTVTATLGALSAEREVDLYEPNLTVTPAYLVALPGAPVSVNVTDGGEPVADATVTVGERVERTGENGTAEAGLPFRNAVSVSASSLSASASTRLDWLFVNLVGVVAVGGVLVVVGVGSVYNRGRLGAFARRVRRFARRIGQAAVDALFALAARLDEWLAGLPALPGVLRAFVERFVDAPVETLRAVARRVRTRAVAVSLAVVAWVVERVPGDADPVSADVGRERAAAATESDADRSVEGAWRVLLGLVAPSRVRTRTPGEIARLAVDRGLPSGPVRTLTDAYRRTVYGDAGARDADVDRARTAAADIERAVDGDGSSDRGETDASEATESTADAGDDGPSESVRTDGGGDA